MSEQTAVTVQQKTDAPAQWGTRDEVGALANRLGTMLPNAQDFSPNELLTISQYCLVADINPYRGEAYFYKDRGKLQMVDGYKILVRWAKDKDAYQDRDEDLPTTDDQAEHVRVWILKDSDRHKVKEWTEMGAPWKDAFEMVATYADGVLTKAETKTRDGRDKSPPTGWTWRQVTRKRALKNALNLSHGAPSPQAMAEYRFKVNGTQTVPADWEGTEELSQGEAEALAALRAKTREHQDEWQQLTPEQHQERLQANVNLMRGPDIDDPLGIDTDTGEITGPDWEQVPDQGAEPTNGNGYDSKEDRAKAMMHAVNQKTNGYYNAVPHLRNAIQLEMGDEEWVWPELADEKAWGAAYKLAVAHTKKDAG